MSIQKLDSHRTNKTASPIPLARVRFDRIIMGGLIALAPSLLAAKGCDVGQIGSDEDSCGGLEGLSCDMGEFCNLDLDRACGAADTAGTCEPIPEYCTEEYAPVCGCDDQTYDNECFAHAAGVSVASEGECDAPPPSVCGGLMGAACEEGEFCKYRLEAMCGAADATGVCKPKPEACDLSYNPVCGCDGETYGNACEANREGVSVAAYGECEQPSNVCGGDMGQSCADDEFCNFPPDAICGAADGTGVCEPKPEACEDSYEPVCGCDDETYGNECYAHAAGVSVASQGECGDEPTNVCGGDMGQSCADDEFCNFPPDAICGFADGTGVCEPIPEYCTEEYAPVCGCDGNTYDNDCFAHAAGVSVQSEGECGEICGGLMGAGCADDEFCSYSEAAMCGATDASGTCEPKPEACTQEYNPVCGCDDMTYGNACSANAAGVSVAYVGECASEGATCGGFMGVTCVDGEFCNYPEDMLCGFADGTGVCEPIPMGCPDVDDPVCGCDGETYFNECQAHAAGVSVQSAGACEE